eukprot:2446005-Rhodomonas_salina.1
MPLHLPLTPIYLRVLPSSLAASDAASLSQAPSATARVSTAPSPGLCGSLTSGSLTCSAWRGAPPATSLCATSSSPSSTRSFPSPASASRVRIQAPACSGRLRLLPRSCEAGCALA